MFILLFFSAIASINSVPSAGMALPMPGTCGRTQLALPAHLCQLRPPPVLPCSQRQIAPEIIQTQCIEHCISLLPAIQAIQAIQLNRNNPQALSTFQCSCAPKGTVEAASAADGIASSFGQRVSWATNFTSHSHVTALHVSLLLEKLNSLLLVINYLTWAKCHRGGRCQLTCAKYPQPISWRQPNPTPTRHHAHVSRSPRCGHKTWTPSSSDLRQTRRPEYIETPASCNDHLSMQLTYNHHGEVTWPGPLICVSHVKRCPDVSARTPPAISLHSHLRWGSSATPVGTQLMNPHVHAS